ncbi:Nuclear hormone receptor HR96 [Halotydeus destructor]|nr:Nuclear hormone receptor HR96 [Halotydeus destructor]
MSAINLVDSDSDSDSLDMSATSSVHQGDSELPLPFRHWYRNTSHGSQFTNCSSSPDARGYHVQSSVHSHLSNGNATDDNQQISMMNTPGIILEGNSLTIVPRPGLKSSHVCSVCGDRAFYVFYGALACDSCRTFFRRQVLQGKTLSCHFKNNCDIQLNTRKDCAKCRLAKCLTVGMKQSLVAVNEVGPNGQSSLSRGRPGRSPANGGHPGHLPMCGPHSQAVAYSANRSMTESVYSIQPSHVPISIQPNSRLPKSAVIGSSLSGFATHSSQSHDDNNIAQSVKRASSALSSAPNVITSHRQVADEVLSPVDRLANHSDCANSETRDGIRIETLLAERSRANSGPDSPPLTIGTDVQASLDRALLHEVDKMAESLLVRPMKVAERQYEVVMAAKFLYIGIERTVRACQGLTPFRMLTASSQAALLRGGCSEMLLLQSLYHFNAKDGCWQFPVKKNANGNSDTRLDASILKKVNDLMVGNYTNFAHSIEERWRKDKTVIPILTAITLLSPERCDAIDLESVKASQICYIQLLKRFVESILGPTEGSAAYHKLTSSLERLKNIRDDFESVTFNLTETEVSQLRNCFGDLSL